MKNPLANFAKIGVFALTMAAMTGSVMAQTPAAGVRIGNQAVATYTDPSGIPRVVTSNLVETVISQIAALRIDDPSASFSQQGSQIVFPHRITNNGNGTDTFNILITQSGADNFDLATLQAFADTDSNGVPDDLTNPITVSTPVAPGETFTFVVVGSVPVAQPNADFAEITVEAQSVFDNAVRTGLVGSNAVNNPISDVDRVTVTSQAIIEIQKSMSSQAGPDDGVTLVTVRIDYGNTGIATAPTMTITDALPQVGAGGMDYVAGSGRWSVTGAGAPMTDAAGGDPLGPPGSVIDFEGLVGTDTITATITNIPQSTQGFITFQFTVRNPTQAGTLVNTGSVTYNDGVAAIGPVPSNPVPYVIADRPGVTIVAPPPIASIPQGGTATFTNVVTNTGNNLDTMDITLTPTGTPFPPGTIFTLYKSDGVSLLLDTNSTGIVDTGPLAVGASYNVILTATVPPGVSGGGIYSVTKTATTENVDGTNTPATDNDDDILTTIVAGQVDLTDGFSVDGGAEAGASAPGLAAAAYPGSNADGFGDGQGAGPTAAALEWVHAREANPGQTVTFNLVVNMTQDPADNFDLAAFSDQAMTVPHPFTVVFRDRNGATIGNTGPLSMGAADAVDDIGGAADGPDEKLVVASVTIPAGTAPGAVDVFFRARSPSTAVQDGLKDRIFVGTVRDVRLSPDNQQKQTSPNNFVVFPHILENFGNVTECNGEAGSSDCGLTVADSNAAIFTSTVFIDINDDGILDAGDILIPAGVPYDGVAGLPANIADGLSPGERVRIFIRTFAAPGATAGDADDATLTATVVDGPTIDFTDSTAAAVPDPTVPPVTDHVIVVFGDLGLEKAQALDAACDGTPDTGYGLAVITAAPNQCVRYRLTLTNSGSTASTATVLSDSTPAFTTLDDGDNATGATGVPSFQINGGGFTAVTGADPGDGGTGTISETLGTLNPADTAVMFFGVRVDP